ncbi:MAG: hypothetical protein K6U00_11065, partial [Armatimonadetes bacterium]|nr:hypothetical protein [Armatimonadota bacterium]
MHIRLNNDILLIILPNNLLVNEKQVSGLEITYQYDEAGNRTKITRGAQNHSVFTYDERDRLSGISHVVGGSPAASVSYTRDGVGSPTFAAWVNGQADWTVSYEYDAMNRLTYEDHSERGDTLWSYDWVGNRLDYGFEYDAQTDWLSEGPAGVGRTYDSAGNMTQKGTRPYWYNTRGLLGMTNSSGLCWDGEQRLLTHSIWTGNSFVTYTWVYDPTASIPAVIQEFSSSGRNVVYIREPDGSLVARFEPGENPVADHYYFDSLGSTVMMTEGLSTITDR